MVRYIRLLFVALAALAAGCSKGRSEAKPADGTGPDRIQMVDRVPRGQVRTIPEKEPNNTAGTATAVSAGAVAQGNLDSSNDVDYYELHVTKPGVLSLRLTGIDKVDLILDLRDSADKRLARSDRGPARTVEGVPNYRVSKGDYYLVVREFVKKKKRKRRRRRRHKRKKKKPAKAEPPARVGKSPNYQLSIDLRGAPMSGVTEKEPNDKKETALELKPDAQGAGFIGWAHDKDMWKLVLDDVTGDEVIDVDVAGVSRVRLVLEILDSYGKQLVRRWGSQGKAVIVRGLRPRKGQGVHYARLFARRSQPNVSYTITFSIRTAEPSDEIEPNDRREWASSLIDGSATTPPQSGGMRQGFLTRGDVDYYELPKRDQPMMLNLSVTPPGEVDPVLFVMDANGGVLQKVDAGKRGVKETVSNLRIPANTQAFIKVSGNGDSVQPERYTLRWSVEPAGAAPAPATTPKPKTPATAPGNKLDLDDEYGN